MKNKLEKKLISGAMALMTFAPSVSALSGVDKSLLSAAKQAYSYGCADTVRELLRSGANANVIDPDSGCTALMYAIDKGANDEVVAELLKNGADPNIVTTGGDCYTPLMHAISRERLDIVALLLKHGAKLYPVNRYGQTAFDMVLSHKSSKPSLVILFIEYLQKSSPEVLGELLQAEMRSGNFIAVRTIMALISQANEGSCGGHDELKAPLAKRRRISPTDQRNTVVSKVLQDLGIDMTYPAQSGNTPLADAAECGCEHLVRFLLDCGADVNAECDFGDTALILAAENGNTAVAKLLLEHGADVNAENEDGSTALFMSFASGCNTELIKLLLEYGADVNAESLGDGTGDSDLGGNTPLSKAARFGNVGLVKLLLEHGADVDFARWKCCSPLTCAVQGQDLEVLRLLLEHSQKRETINNALLYSADNDDFNEALKILLEFVPDDGVRTEALCIAAKYGAVENVKALLSLGLDVNARTQEGDTALTLAAGSECTDFYGVEYERTGLIDNSEVVKLLLEHGADLRARNKEGKTALDLVHEHGNEQLIGFLCSQSAKH